eukprot:TRINITY_DN26048_c0_g1_i1.p1 TRINITY_DN26048_c0_g1~~TRINITY_DN26048_c0_g1_i1.p1  ORF type:complete len:1528 (+),score=265.26 TRINITY_DN26048_c0_g1_i1:110-4693(+)
MQMTANAVGETFHPDSTGNLQSGENMNRQRSARRFLITDAEDEVNSVRSAIFSGGLYHNFRDSVLNGDIARFRGLLVLDVSETLLHVMDLTIILQTCPYLIKLNASGCGLQSVPKKSAFEHMNNLRVLNLHRNSLTRWAELESVCACPVLTWLTLYENPLAGQPQCRAFILERSPGILAIDFKLVTDLERLGSDRHQGPSPGLKGFRFQGAFVDPDTDINQYALWNGRLEVEEADPKVDQMVSRALKEIDYIKLQSVYSSPASCIQANWRGKLGRRYAESRKQVIMYVVTRVQQRARALIRKRRLNDYVKEYLTEVDELDLLLDAKEMLRRRAHKIIERETRRWIAKRNRQMRERRAAERITRHARGFLVRRQLLYSLSELEGCPGFYFPEQHAWEFRVLCNVTLKSLRLPELPANHEFVDSRIIGIRWPEVDDAPPRSSTIHSLFSYGGYCLARPIRSARYSSIPWDGPFHKIVVGECPPRIARALDKVKRRGTNVNTRSRKAFCNSCCPGRHPIDRGSVEGETNLKEEEECLRLKEIMEGPESMWPQRDDRLLQLFMQAAKSLGCKKWHKSTLLASGKVDDTTGIRSYSDTAWLSQRMLFHRCHNPKVAVNLLLTIHRFSKLASKLPSVQAIPVLHEKGMLKLCAATVIQSSWRARRDRLKLGFRLHTAIVLRRAAICIQRSWRWGLLKRRLALLTSALRVVLSIKSSHLYIEERLLAALDSISSIDRYPPLIREATLGFAYTEKDDAPVLLQLPISSAPHALDPHRQGLPRWFRSQAQIEDMRLLTPEDSSLRRGFGLHALILESLGERTEEHMLTIASPFIETFARESAARGVDAKLEGENVPAVALEASGGSFRFAELRCSSLAQARQKALMLYLCTYDTHLHAGVSLLSRSQLGDKQILYSILRLWDLYGLCWPSDSSKVALFLLKQHAAQSGGFVLFNGPRVRSTVDLRANWVGVEDEQSKSRHGANREERDKHRRELFDQKIAQFLKSNFEEIHHQLDGLHISELQAILESGHGLQQQQDGTEAWVVGSPPEQLASKMTDPSYLARIGKLEKESVAAMLAESKAHEEFIVGQQRAWAKEWKAMKKNNEFETRLMDFYGAAHQSKLAAEEHCMKTQPCFSSASSSRPFKTRQPHVMALGGAATKLPRLVFEKKWDDADMERETLIERREAAAVRKTAECESARSKIRQEKTARAMRREARVMAGTFSDQVAALQRLTKHEDLERAKLQQDHMARTHVSNLNRERSDRTRRMAVRQHRIINHRRDNVDALRKQLQEMEELRISRDAEELHAKQASIIEQQTLDRLLKAARAQLDSLSKGVELPDLAEVSKVLAKPGNFEEETEEKEEDAISTIAGETGQGSELFTSAAGFRSTYQGGDMRATISSDLARCSPKLSHAPSSRIPVKAMTASDWHTGAKTRSFSAYMSATMEANSHEFRKFSDDDMEEEFLAPFAPVAPPAWPHRPAQPPPDVKRSPRAPVSAQHIKPPSAGSGGWSPHQRRSAAEPWLRRFGKGPVSARTAR